MHSFPKPVDFHLKAPGYREKDGHDSCHNDSWPGLSFDCMGTFSWKQGLKVHTEQIPMSDKPCRAFRWGKALRAWVVEGREFRPASDMADSLSGAEQKQWLKNTVLASDWIHSGERKTTGRFGGGPAVGGVCDFVAGLCSALQKRIRILTNKLGLAGAKATGTHSRTPVSHARPTPGIVAWRGGMD